MNGSENSIDNRRIVPLEALRGLAACIVFQHHFVLGFLPGYSGLFDDLNTTGHWTPLGTPLFLFINGPSAVTFFFVLSGFVLTRSMFAKASADNLVASFIKRWPRLLGLVLLVTLLSWACFYFGLYAYEAAARLTGSPWLASFGTGLSPGFEPSLHDAVQQGAFKTFFNGTSNYNSSLWTMRYELKGSYLAFLLAAGIIWLQGRPRWRLAMLAGWVLAAVWLFKPYMACFLVGVALAWLQARRPWRWSLWAGAACLLGGLYLCGFGKPQGLYAWAAMLPLAELPRAVILNTLGALLTIMAVLGTPRFYRALNNRFGVWLGRLSFPFYLMQLLVLCSAGAGLFIALEGSAWQLPATYGVSLLLTILASIPLAYFDEGWTRMISRLTRRGVQAVAPQVAKLNPRTTPALPQRG